jgi:hypothetical protein
MAKLSAEEIRNKFGLEYNEGHESAGAGNTTDWGGDESTGAVYNRHTGTYIGTIPGYGRKDSGGGSSGEMRQDSGIGSFEAIEKYGLEHNLTKQRNRWSSINDVAGAATDIHQEGKKKAAAPELEEAELSNTANKALAYTEAYDDFQRGGGGVELRAGNLDSRQDFMDMYKLNLQKRMEPGTAGEFGADQLNMHGHNEINAMRDEQKTSKIAADIVGKGAGFQSV